MGLDAAVFRRLEEMSFSDEDRRFVTADPQTGYINFEDPALFETWGGRVMAINKRIGNMQFVSLLKTELEQHLGAFGSNTLLIRKILYSGTHSGDFISQEELAPLKRELAEVREITRIQKSQELQRFLLDLEELIAASEQHHNPIVFI